MKYLKHSLLLLVRSGFLTGEIAAIESSLPPCPTKKGFFSGVSKWKHCYGSIEGGGYKYVGEFKDEKFHGQGTLIYPDGHKYVVLC